MAGLAVGSSCRCSRQRGRVVVPSLHLPRPEYAMARLPVGSTACAFVWLLLSQPSPAQALDPNASPVRVARPGMVLLPNLGQWPEAVRFRGAVGRMSLDLEPQALVMRLREADRVRGLRIGLPQSAAAMPRGERTAAGLHHYGVGPRAAWRSGMQGFASVRYPSIRPGVDLLVRAEPDWPEYDLEVAAGAELDAVQFSVQGHDAMAVDAEGALRIAVDGAELVQPRPVAWYQADDGVRIPVACSYRIQGEAGFGFAVAERRELPLVIDPGLIWSSYWGGAGADSLGDVVWGYVDHMFVTGWRDDGATGRNLYVEKLGAGGATLWTRTIGGSRDDVGVALAYDAGDLFVVGTTNSGDIAAVGTPTHPAKLRPGGSDRAVLVAKIDDDSGAVVWIDYLDGSGEDVAGDIAATAGDVFVTGTTSLGIVADFPIRSSPAGAVPQANPLGGRDAFVARLDQDGNEVWCSFLGGSLDDEGLGIAVAADNEPWVTGVTASADFPRLGGGGLVGDRDVFVTRFLADGNGHAASRLHGGGAADIGHDITLYGDGTAAVVGSTGPPQPPQASFPSSGSGGVVARLGPSGGREAFAMRLGTSASLMRCVVFGSTGDDEALGVSVLENGYTAVTGRAGGTGFLTTNDCLDGFFSGPTTPVAGEWGDTFVVVLEQVRSLAYSTLLGGDQPDVGRAIAMRNGGLAVVGMTVPPGFWLEAAARPTGAGPSEGFAAWMEPADFGDLPDDGDGSKSKLDLAWSMPARARSYWTRLRNGGPWYRECFWQRLGGRADLEEDCRRDPGDVTAMWEDRPEHLVTDDGVVFGPWWVTVTVTHVRPSAQTYRIDAWFDINRNGTFEEPAEHMIRSDNGGSGRVALPAGPSSQRFRYYFIPTWSPLDHYARFRLTYDVPDTVVIQHHNRDAAGATVELVSPNSGISHGEVEDYPPLLGSIFCPGPLREDPGRQPAPGLDPAVLGVQSIAQVNLVRDPTLPHGVSLCSLTVTGLAPAAGGAGGFDVLLGSYDAQLGVFTQAPPAFHQALNTPADEFGLMLNPATTTVDGVIHPAGTLAVLNRSGPDQVLHAVRGSTAQPFVLVGPVPGLDGARDPALAIRDGAPWLLWVETDPQLGDAIVGAPFDPADGTVDLTPTLFVSHDHFQDDRTPHSPTPITGPDGDTEALLFHANLGNDSDAWLLPELGPGARLFRLDDTPGWGNNGGIVGGTILQAYDQPTYHVYDLGFALLTGDDERHRPGPVRSAELGLRAPILAPTEPPFLAVLGFNIVDSQPGPTLPLPPFAGELALLPGPGLLSLTVGFVPQRTGELAVALQAVESLRGLTLRAQGLLFRTDPLLGFYGAFTNDCMVRL